MSNAKKLIASLDQKVEMLLTHVKEQQRILEDKKYEVIELSRRLTKAESNFNELKVANETLKNNPADIDGDSDNVKAKISELVREIDNCISLLKV